MSVDVLRLHRRSTSSVSTVDTPDRSQPIAEPLPQSRTDQLFQLSARTDKSCQPPKGLEQSTIGCRSFRDLFVPLMASKRQYTGLKSATRRVKSTFTHRGGPARTGAGTKPLALDDTTSIARFLSSTPTHREFSEIVMRCGR